MYTLIFNVVLIIQKLVYIVWYICKYSQVTETEGSSYRRSNQSVGALLSTVVSDHCSSVQTLLLSLLSYESSQEHVPL